MTETLHTHFFESSHMEEPVDDTDPKIHHYHVNKYITEDAQDTLDATSTFLCKAAAEADGDGWSYHIGPSRIVPCNNSQCAIPTATCNGYGKDTE